MLKIGLTGGIGCGKSTAVKYFQSLAVPIIDADVIARNVVEPGQPALQQIAQAFGTNILNQDDSLNRGLLREQVFNNAEQLATLEAILHPLIKESILNKINEYKGQTYIIVDVPLLFEKNYTKLFDRVLVIDCLPDQQKQRVKQRDGSESGVIESIMQTQINRDKRLSLADDILKNTTTVEDLYQQINQLHIKYLALSDT
jgi:dephospho-CoA kinase